MFVTGFGAVDPDMVSAQIADWTRVLDGLNQALILAKQANNASMLAQVRVGIEDVRRRLIDLNNQITGQEMPGAVMMALSDFSSAVVQTAKDAGLAAKDLGGAATRSVNALPILLAVLLGVVGIGLYKGSLGVHARFP